MKELYGLIGRSLKHSWSPEIHKAILEKLEIDGEYQLFELAEEDLAKAVKKLIMIQAKGVNVTIPYKISIIKSLDDMSNEAERIGAVNTIVFNDKKAVGYNTDYYGFGMMLSKNELNLENKKIVVLGSGGAAKCVSQYLKDKNAGEVTVVSRNPESADMHFKNTASSIISYDELKKIGYRDYIINCTPSGMYNYSPDPPVEKGTVSKFSAAVDLIYNPKRTEFLKYADELGIKGINGHYMLVGQAAAAQELWNKTKIDMNTIDYIYEKTKNLYESCLY